MAIPSADSGARRLKHWSLALLAFVQLIYSLDINIVFVTLPEIGAGLGFSAQTLQWVVSAYTVCCGGFLLFGGRAADLLGQRRVFIFALWLYALSSLAGGLAGSPVVIVIARAIQGIGAALLFPSTLSLINRLFEEGPSRNRAQEPAAWRWDRLPEESSPAPVAGRQCFSSTLCWRPSQFLPLFLSCRKTASGTSAAVSISRAR